MNVIINGTGERTIQIIPRYYAESDVLVSLYNEETKATTNFTVTPENLDGYMYVSFSGTFRDKTNYQIKITEGDDVVYRGKMFVTSQAGDTQSYKIEKDVFTI